MTLCPHFDFTPQDQGRGKRHRPTARQIVAAWKRAGKPEHFTVAYGETFAVFQRVTFGGQFIRWDDAGNGCRGVDRNAVVKALRAAEEAPR